MKVFKKIRRFGTTDNKPIFYSNHIYKNARIIASSSLDNIIHKSDDEFKTYVEDLVSSLKKAPQTVVLTTHQVNDADWGISLSRLDFFIQHAKENGILFCGM